MKFRIRKDGEIGEVLFSGLFSPVRCSADHVSILCRELKMRVDYVFIESEMDEELAARLMQHGMMETGNNQALIRPETGCEDLTDLLFREEAELFFLIETTKGAKLSLMDLEKKTWKELCQTSSISHILLVCEDEQQLIYGFRPENHKTWLVLAKEALSLQKQADKSEWR